MWSILKRHAARHALVYVIAVGLGLQAFGTGFYDNFWPIEPEDMAKLGWWQVCAAVLKSMSFSIGIVVGYLIKGPQGDRGAQNLSATPPPAHPPRDYADSVDTNARRNTPPAQ
jgi:hypothetical protein